MRAGATASRRRMSSPASARLNSSSGMSGGKNSPAPRPSSSSCAARKSRSTKCAARSALSRSGKSQRANGSQLEKSEMRSGRTSGSADRRQMTSSSTLHSIPPAPCSSSALRFAPHAKPVASGSSSANSIASREHAPRFTKAATNCIRSSSPEYKTGTSNCRASSAAFARNAARCSGRVELSATTNSAVRPCSRRLSAKLSSALASSGTRAPPVGKPMVPMGGGAGSVERIAAQTFLTCSDEINAPASLSFGSQPRSASTCSGCSPWRSVYSAMCVSSGANSKQFAANSSANEGRATGAPRRE